MVVPAPTRGRCAPTSVSSRGHICGSGLHVPGGRSEPAGRGSPDRLAPARALPRRHRRRPGPEDGPRNPSLPAESGPCCRRPRRTANPGCSRAERPTTLRSSSHPARHARIRRRRPPVPAPAPRPANPRARREVRPEDRNRPAPVPAAGEIEAGRSRRPAHGEAALRTAGVRLARGPAAPTRHKPNAPHRPRRDPDLHLPALRSQRPRHSARQPTRPARLHHRGRPNSHSRFAGAHGDRPALRRARCDRLLVEDLRRRSEARPGGGVVGVGLQQLPGLDRRRARSHAGDAGRRGTTWRRCSSGGGSLARRAATCRWESSS